VQSDVGDHQVADLGGVGSVSVEQRLQSRVVVLDLLEFWLGGQSAIFQQPLPARHLLLGQTEEPGDLPHGVGGGSALCIHGLEQE
jgi:hypothetical protein